MSRPFVLFIVCAALVATPAVAEIYKWVDDQGVVHYSDKPVGNAHPANLPKLQSADRTQIESGGDLSTPNPGQIETNSLTVALQRPHQRETFRDGRGLVPLQAVLDPQLAGGQKLRYYLDGNLASPATRKTSLQLTGVARGEHTVSVAVVNDAQDTVARSVPVTFYMQPPSTIGPLNQSAPNADGQQPAGATTAPATTNSKGAPAAPRFNTGNAPAGSPRP